MGVFSTVIFKIVRKKQPIKSSDDISFLVFFITYLCVWATVYRGNMEILKFLIIIMIICIISMHIFTHAVLKKEEYCLSLMTI